jgi:hypothetical protein
MEIAEDTLKKEKLKIIIYKLTRGKELANGEKEIIDRIIEEKDYAP